MYILLCGVIGAVVGWLTGKVLKGNQFGPAMDILMGILGAEAATLLMRFAVLDGRIRVLLTPPVAIVGALTTTVLVAFLNGRKRYA